MLSDGSSKATSVGLLNTPEIAAAIISEVGSVAHEAWKLDHFAIRGVDAPRWKATSDDAFVKKNRGAAESGSQPWLREKDGILEVNIAALRYSELPADWQEENRKTGEVVLNLLKEALSKDIDIHSNAFLVKAVAEVHTKWLERNHRHAEEFQKQSLDELARIVRLEGSPDRIKAHRNIVMDLNYVLAGVQALLKAQFNSGMGFEEYNFSQ